MGRGRGIWVLLTSVMAGGFLLAQAPAPAGRPEATLNQLMRGVFFPQSNVFFFAQGQNPADVKGAAEPSAATDPLTGVFGKWEAVENSALALADTANLLMIPGRKCSNGKDVPLANPDWQKFVEQLRAASLTAYKAAQSRNQEQIFMAAEVLNNSCADCHRKYRPRVAANRCQ